MTPNNRPLQGIPASPGIVLGRAKVLSEHVETQPCNCLLYSPEEIDVEQDRFLKAVEQAEADLIALRESLSPEYQEHGHLLDVQILMLKERMIFQETSGSSGRSATMPNGPCSRPGRRCGSCFRASATLISKAASRTRKRSIAACKAILPARRSGTFLPMSR